MKISTITIALSILISAFSCQKTRSPEIKLANNTDSLSLFAEGIVSTGLYERDIAINKKGDEIIYTLGDAKQNKRCLVNLQQAGTSWSQPQVLSISGTYQDIEPFLTQDGQRLFFASNRPLPVRPDAKDYNIWYTTRQGENWGIPIPLDTIINTKGDEFYPSLSDNGNLYFTATRSDGIGREDIFVAKLQNETYQKPTVLDSVINTAYYEFNAYISPDEDLLIFSSFGRKDDLGGGDLYYSKKDKTGKWQTAKNMGEHINSDKLDYCPFVDMERGVFYFTSERTQVSDKKIETIQALKNYANASQNGLGDIYRINLSRAIQ